MQVVPNGDDEQDSEEGHAHYYKRDQLLLGGEAELHHKSIY